MAAIAAVGLTWFAIDRSNQMARSDELAERAIAMAKQADNEKLELSAKVDQLTRDLDTLDVQVAKAQKAVDDAQNDADRKKAAADLIAVNHRKWEAKVAADAAKAALEKKLRNTKIDVTGCTGTALGCLKH